MIELQNLKEVFLKSNKYMGSVVYTNDQHLNITNCKRSPYAKVNTLNRFLFLPSGLASGEPLVCWRHPVVFSPRTGLDNAAKKSLLLSGASFLRACALHNEG